MIAESVRIALGALHREIDEAAAAATTATATAAVAATAATIS